MIGFTSLKIDISNFKITNRTKHSNLLKILLENSSSYKQNKITNCKQKYEHN